MLFHHNNRCTNAPRCYVIRSSVQKFPAWHTKAAPNGKCCEGYIVPSMVRLMYQLKSVLKNRETMLKNSKFVLFVTLKKVGQAGNIWTLLRTYIDCIVQCKLQVHWSNILLLYWRGGCYSTVYIPLLAVPQTLAVFRRCLTNCTLSGNMHRLRFQQVPNCPSSPFFPQTPCTITEPCAVCHTQYACLTG